MEKKKVALLVVGCSILAALISAGTVIGVNKLTTKEDTVVTSTSTANVPEDVSDTITVEENLVQAEVLDEDTGNVATFISGGSAVINTASGETINCYIADDMFLISDNYLDIMSQGFGVSQAITAPNTVITGNMPSVTESLTSINAAPFSDIDGIYAQIFGADYSQEDATLIWSPAYTYMKTGEFPEKLPDNYKCEEYNSFTHENIKWTCYNVSYTSDYTKYYDDLGNAIPEEEIVPNIVSTQHLACYSDTDDAVEILVYEESNSVDKEYEMLLEFLGVQK